jgi:hypothetical protein
MAHLLRLPVISVIVAGGKSVGAQHDAPFHLRAESLARVLAYMGIRSSCGTRKP